MTQINETNDELGKIYKLVKGEKSNRLQRTEKYERMIFSICDFDNWNELYT